MRMVKYNLSRTTGGPLSPWPPLAMVTSLQKRWNIVFTKKKKESEMMFLKNETEMTYKVLYSSDTEFKFSY